MPLDRFSAFDLIAALDMRNVEAHRTGAVEDCTACATTARPGAGCPASLAAQIRNAAATGAAPFSLTPLEIIDELLALRRSSAF
ncbi:hypothetical protein ACRS6B_21175 [Nocardia asteroides]